MREIATMTATVIMRVIVRVTSVFPDDDNCVDDIFVDR